MPDDDQILICAFRYCLGRQTYIVSDCVRWIRERWVKLSPAGRKLLFDELSTAIERDRLYQESNPGKTSMHLGSALDAPHWQELYAWIARWPALNESERHLLFWLGEEDFNQYGECHGKSLDRLVELGLAQIHAPGEHQSGFIAQDHAGTRGDMFRAVSLTDAGSERLRSERQS